MVSLDEVGKSRKRASKRVDEDSAQLADRADLLPSSGFWLEVDGRTKKGWPELDTAQREARTLKQKYPHLRIAVYDAAEKKRSSAD